MKHPSAFTEQFSRLGLAMHLSNLAGPPTSFLDDSNQADQSGGEKGMAAEGPPPPPPQSSDKEETDGGEPVAATTDRKQEQAVRIYNPICY